MNSDASQYEPIYTWTDWYDGPRGGIAEFQGRPHLYEAEFDFALGYSEVFLLMPLDADTVRLALEDWEIWRKWDAAHKAGLTPEETFPALPEDRRRHEEITSLLDGKLVADPARAIRAKADFRTRAGLVRWMPV
jgi:hypothetical protein